MPKALCIAGMAIAAILFILFAWDLTGLFAPFKQANMLMDIAFVISSVALGYLSWTTWKEQV